MTRIIRAVVLMLIVSAALVSSGCLHTWTGTYAEYPDSMYQKPHVHGQDNPNDG
jgi:hypothetical protein